MALAYAAVNVSPDPPHRGAAWGLPRGLPGGLLFVQAPGVWPQIGITGFVYIENLSDYSSDCYKIKVLILQNIEAVMFKFSRGVDVRQSNMFKVMGGGAGASAMFKVMGGEGRQPCSRWWQGGWGASAMFKVMAVSHVQGDGRGVRSVSHVQGDGGWVASAMFKVITRGVRSVSHVQGDGRQPCSRWLQGGGTEGHQPFSRWWRGWGASAIFKVMGGEWGASTMFKVMGGGEGRQPCSRWWGWGASVMFKVMTREASVMFKVMWGVSAMFKVMAGGGGVVSHVQVDERGWGATATFNVMAGGEGRQPCSRWCEGRQPCSRWWQEVRGVSHVGQMGLLD